MTLSGGRGEAAMPLDTIVGYDSVCAMTSVADGAICASGMRTPLNKAEIPSAPHAL